MNVCILIDHYPLPPRAIKMKLALETYGCHVGFFAWNRNNVTVKETYVSTLNQDIQVGNQVKKLFHLPKLFIAFKHYLSSKQIDAIVAIDVEMMLIASQLKKKRILIYEVYDIKFFKQQWLNRVRHVLENKALKHRVSGVVFASPFFNHYYQLTSIPMVVMNNKPSKSLLDSLNSSIVNHHEVFTIGFIGVVRYEEILKNLMIAVSELNEKIRVLIAGDGPHKARCEQFAQQNNYDFVEFTGRFELNQLSELYNRTSLVWAAYPNNDANVKYAISNKFFEAQFFQKPIIVSEDTHLEKWVLNNHLGYSVNPFSVESIKSTLNYAMSNFMDFHGKIDENMFHEDELPMLEAFLKQTGIIA